MIRNRTNNSIYNPGSKLFVLLISILVVAFSYSVIYQFCYMMLLTIYGITSGKWKISIITMLVYSVMAVTIWFAGAFLVGTTWGIMLNAGFGFFMKIFPCCMAAAILMSSTKISELLTIAVKLRVPRKIYIPMAIMCRYIPVIREDWRYIRGAMKLRGINLSPRSVVIRPALTVECLYVPLMMSASKAVDELSAAAITRGIENPNRRTCMVDLQLNIGDIILMLIFMAAFAAGFFIQR